MFGAPQVEVLQRRLQAMKSSLGQGDVVVAQLESGELLQAHESVVGNLSDVVLGQVQEVQHGQRLQGTIRHRCEEILL